MTKLSEEHRLEAKAMREEDYTLQEIANRFKEKYDIKITPQGIYQSLKDFTIAEEKEEKETVEKVEEKEEEFDYEGFVEDLEHFRKEKEEKVKVTKKVIRKCDLCGGEVRKVTDEDKLGSFNFITHVCEKCKVGYHD